jgi:MFS family permease
LEISRQLPNVLGNRVFIARAPVSAETNSGQAGILASLSLALESPFPARKRVILLSAPYERRAPMIAFTYVASSVLLTGSGALFAYGTISATQQTFFWSIIFFFASAAASSAYLTVSETFPLEILALAISFFYAIGTGIGGVAGPWLFGALIDTDSPVSVFGGYLLGAALMIGAGLIAWFFSVSASASRSKRWCGRSPSRIELRPSVEFANSRAVRDRCRTEMEVLAD